MTLLKRIMRRKLKIYTVIYLQQKDTFIVTADNFSIVNGDPNNPIFLYQINTENEHDKIVSPYGRSIIVDANYIKKNNIQLVETGKVEEASAFG